MKIQYQNLRFRKKGLILIGQANEIIEEFAADGYDLTLRQLYYQFVARDMFPEDRRWTWTGSKWRKDPKGTKNAPPNYKRLGDYINNARLAGLTDWESIVDRTRKSNCNSHWDSPSDIIDSARDSYQRDTRATQKTYIEVWIEKDALIGVLKRVCTKQDVRYMSCRGYVSQSAMWQAAQRFDETRKENILLHLGDHDPSGIDMTRDIQARLDMFGADIEVIRIALNMEQVEQYNPPPDPAKVTDSRYDGYVAEYGDESWELDALNPKVITGLIAHHIDEHTDKSKCHKLIRLQESEREQLDYVARSWDEICGEMED